MKALIEAWKEDLGTYRGDWAQQGYWALVVHRFGEWRYGIRTAFLRRFCSLIYKIGFKLVQIATGIELPCEARVGRGTRIDHFGGIVVSGYASVGDHCVIRQGVTIGLRHEAEPCGPKLGSHVNIGAGAKILGSVVIGDHVDIGANAVVLTDIPSHCTAVGVPARIIPKRQEQIAA